MAGLIGMLVAFMTIRKKFSGKATLDFISNLGGAVPGTILGIGYILAFIQAPWWAFILVYAALALYFSSVSGKSAASRGGLVLGATLIGYLLSQLPGKSADGALMGFETWLYLLAGILVVTAGIAWGGSAAKTRRAAAFPLLGMAAFLVIRNLSGPVLTKIVIWSRSLPGTQLPKLASSFSDHLGVFLQPTSTLMGLTFIMIGIFAIAQVGSRVKLPVSFLLLTTAAALSFTGEPMALIGTAYIIIFAYAVRSLPASVRAGVAALQQIDPSIEEASSNLGANAQYTFRRITLPLILPAFIAGLIFSFARHMTSLSAIIFLSTPKWRILTVEILSAVEQGGMSMAAAYSVILIVIVLIAIGLTYFILGRTLGSSGEQIDLNV